MQEINTCSNASQLIETADERLNAFLAKEKAHYASKAKRGCSSLQHGPMVKADVESLKTNRRVMRLLHHCAGVLVEIHEAYLDPVGCYGKLYISVGREPFIFRYYPNRNYDNMKLGLLIGRISNDVYDSREVFEENINDGRSVL